MSCAPLNPKELCHRRIRKRRDNAVQARNRNHNGCAKRLIEMLLANRHRLKPRADRMHMSGLDDLDVVPLMAGPVLVILLATTTPK
jgi:hypothetical protein